MHFKSSARSGAGLNGVLEGLVLGRVLKGVLCSIVTLKRIVEVFHVRYDVNREVSPVILDFEDCFKFFI